MSGIFSQAVSDLKQIHFEGTVFKILQAHLAENALHALELTRGFKCLKNQELPYQDHAPLYSLLSQHARCAGTLGEAIVLLKHAQWSDQACIQIAPLFVMTGTSTQWVYWKEVTQQFIELQKCLPFSLENKALYYNKTAQLIRNKVIEQKAKPEASKKKYDAAFVETLKKEAAYQDLPCTPEYESIYQAAALNPSIMKEIVQCGFEFKNLLTCRVLSYLISVLTQEDWKTTAYLKELGTFPLYSLLKHYAKKCLEENDYEQDIDPFDPEKSLERVLGVTISARLHTAFLWGCLHSAYIAHFLPQGPLNKSDETHYLEKILHTGITPTSQLIAYQGDAWGYATQSDQLVNLSLLFKHANESHLLPPEPLELRFFHMILKFYNIACTLLKKMKLQGERSLPPSLTPRETLTQIFEWAISLYTREHALTINNIGRGQLSEALSSDQVLLAFSLKVLTTYGINDYILRNSEIPRDEKPRERRIHISLDELQEKTRGMHREPSLMSTSIDTSSRHFRTTKNTLLTFDSTLPWAPSIQGISYQQTTENEALYPGSHYFLNIPHPAQERHLLSECIDRPVLERSVSHHYPAEFALQYCKTYFNPSAEKFGLASTLTQLLPFVLEYLACSAKDKHLKKYCQDIADTQATAVLKVVLVFFILCSDQPEKAFSSYLQENELGSHYGILAQPLLETLILHLPRPFVELEDSTMELHSLHYILKMTLACVPVHAEGDLPFEEDFSFFQQQVHKKMALQQGQIFSSTLAPQKSYTPRTPVAKLLTQLRQASLPPKNEVITQSLEKIQKICSEEFSNQRFFGNAALNRKILLDSRIADLLTSEVIAYLFSHPEVSIKIARNSGGAVELRDALWHAFNEGGLMLLKHMPNNEPNYTLESAQRQIENFTAHTLRIVSHITQAVEARPGELEKDIFKADLKAQFEKIVSSIRSFQRKGQTLKLLEVANFTAQTIMDQVNQGFNVLRKKLDVSGTLDTFCHEFLSSPEVLLHGDVIHLFYDRLHIEAALVQDTRVTIGKEKYTYEEIFRALIHKLSEPHTYPECAHQQFCMRFLLVEEHLEELQHLSLQAQSKRRAGPRTIPQGAFSLYDRPLTRASSMEYVLPEMD